jgi:dihydrofolate reductase
LIHRIFIIGGTNIYSESLSQNLVDRILLTRIKEPDFECDVFFENFEKDGNWTRKSSSELIEWVGVDVEEGECKEKDVKYEFQMWEKARA